MYHFEEADGPVLDPKDVLALSNRTQLALLGQAEECRDRIRGDKELDRERSILQVEAVKSSCRVILYMYDPQ